MLVISQGLLQLGIEGTPLNVLGARSEQVRVCKQLQKETTLGTALRGAHGSAHQSGAMEGGHGAPGTTHEHVPVRQVRQFASELGQETQEARRRRAWSADAAKRADALDERAKSSSMLRDRAACLVRQDFIRLNRRVAAAVGGQGQARVREVQRYVGQALMCRRRHRHLLPILGAAAAIAQQTYASLE
jgi:hypothetical protein